MMYNNCKLFCKANVKLIKIEVQNVDCKFILNIESSLHFFFFIFSLDEFIS